MNKLTMLILTASLATGTQLAHADMNDNSPKQVLIHYADLDLAGFTGVSILYGRLRSAAQAVCTPLNGKDAERAAAFKHCVTDAMSSAVTQVDQPALSAYHRAKLQGRNAIPLETTARK